MASFLEMLDHIPTFVYVIIAMVALFLYNLWESQERLLFHPTIPGISSRVPSSNPKPFDSPLSLQLRHNDVLIQTCDGNTIHGWFVSPAKGDSSQFPLLIYFHANAGNMGFRLPLVKLLVDALSMNVFIFDYHGYGQSEGEPSEKTLYFDAEAVMSWLESQTRFEFDKSRVILYGSSLGGAVAVYSAMISSIPKALIVENTFTSIDDMVDKIFPYLKYVKSGLLRMHFPTIDRIDKITLPILFISSEFDEIVPTRMMRSLFDRATSSSSKDLYIVKNAGHNDAFQVGGAPLLEKVATWLSSIKIPVGNLHVDEKQRVFPVGNQNQSNQTKSEL
jgi:abhydrolase domain-containing protein 13